MSQAPTQAPAPHPSTPVAQPVSVPSFPSTIELRDAARAQPPRPGFFQSVGDAASSEWVGSWLLRQSARTGFSYDPAFDLNDETLKKLTEGLPEDTWSAFGDAVSMDHAARIRDQMLEVAESRERLARLGWSGVGLRVAASILDPVGIAADAATGGLGYAVKGGRVARAIRTGLVVGGSEAAIEGYLTTQDPERDIRDVLWAGAGGLVLGGAADLLAGGEISKAARKLRKDIEYGEGTALRPGSMGAAMDPRRSIGDRDLLVRLTPEGEMHFRDQATYAERGAYIDDLIERSGFDPVEDADQIAELRNLPPEEALNRFHVPKGAGVAGDTPVQAVPKGAAVNLKNPDGAPPPFEPTLRAGDFDPTPIGAARAAMTGIRRSFSSLLGKSKSDELVQAGNEYITDSLLKQGGKAAREGADVWKSRTVKGFIARYARVANEEFAQWARKARAHPAFSMSARENFMAEVARAIRHEPGTYTTDIHVNRVADMQRSLQEEIRQTAVRHAVKNFDKFEGSPTYLTRAWSPSLVSKAVQLHGAEAVDDFFFNAVMSTVEREARDAITPAQARKIGAGLRRKLTDLDKWTDVDRTLSLSGDNADLITEVLKDAGVTRATIDDVLYGLKKPGDEAGTLNVAKHRVVLDENYAQNMGSGYILRVDDLLDNNAERLFHRYASQVVGQSAATRIYAKHGVEDFAGLKSKIGKSMDAQGIPKAEIDKKLALLEMADKHVRGIPLEQNPGAAAWARRMMGINYLMMSGGFGLAQIPELAGAIASAGWVAMAQQMTEIGRVIRGVKEGTLTGSELADWAEAVAGHGSEHFTNTFTRRFADEIEPDAWKANRFDFGLHQANRLASKVSMLEFIDARARRIAGMLGAQKLVNIAQGRPLSARRLASLGLSAEDGERLTKAIRAELDAQRGIVTEAGVAGRKVNQIRIDQWEDQGAASLFVSAFDRWSRNAVQTNSLGANNPWLTQWQGKMLTQFRGFMVQAWEKQFLHRVQMRDVEAFQSAMATMSTAGTVYIAQQQALAVGRPDRDKFLEERLTPKAIGAAAFQRAGWTSFIPTIIDTSLKLGQRDPLFQYGNTGLSRNMISLDANATSATLNQALRAVGGGIGAATKADEDFGSQDARAMMMLLPFRNVMGVRNVIEAIAQQLPEE